MSASNRTDIITDIALKDVGNTPDGSGAYSGGRVRFGPERYLCVTSGNNHNATLPQGEPAGSAQPFRRAGPGWKSLSRDGCGRDVAVVPS